MAILDVYKRQELFQPLLSQRPRFLLCISGLCLRIRQDLHRTIQDGEHEIFRQIDFMFLHQIITGAILHTAAQIQPVVKQLKEGCSPCLFLVGPHRMLQGELIIIILAAFNDYIRVAADIFIPDG